MANKSLYVGNLPYSVTETSLQAAFASYGGTNVRLVDGRGFGFVEVDADQAQAAIDGMNGQSMEGRTLTVNEARPRGERGGGDSNPSSRAGRW